jgi:hypothetical protein
MFFTRPTKMKTDPTYFDLTDFDPTFSAGRKLLAWGVHIFTTSGVVMGLLTLVAVVNRNWRGALLWLFVAVLEFFANVGYGRSQAAIL